MDVQGKFPLDIHLYLYIITVMNFKKEGNFMRYFTEKDEERLMKELRYYAEKMIELCDHYDKTGEICEIKLLSSDPAVPYRIHEFVMKLRIVVGVALVEKYDNNYQKMSDFEKEELNELYIENQGYVRLFLKIDDSEDGYYRSQLEDNLDEIWERGIAYVKYIKKSRKLDVPDQKCPWTLNELLYNDIDILMEGLK